MSASIYWAPAGKGETLPSSTPSRHVEQLKQLFGAMPLTLKLEEHEGVVNAAHITADDYSKDFWRLLQEALQQHGEIRVWAEY